MIKDSKFVDSNTKNEVKNSLDENSIFKLDPANTKTQQSSFLLQMKTVYLETSKVFQQMQADFSGKCKSICVFTNAVSVLSCNNNASTTSSSGKSETIK